MENIETDNKRLKESMNVLLTEEIAIEAMQYLIRCQWTREQFAHLFMVVEG